MVSKTRKVRKSPEESATLFPEGTIRAGWVIKKTSKGVSRWVPEISVELNGFRRFTTDYAAKNIGKPIILYAREYKDTWPEKNHWTKKPDSTHVIFKFIPNGDAFKGKTKITNWLKTQTQAIKNDIQFQLDGPLFMCNNEKCMPGEHMVDGISVNSQDKKTISPALLNTEVFVKV